MDGQNNETISRFSQFCVRAYKREDILKVTLKLKKILCTYEFRTFNSDMSLGDTCNVIVYFI